MAYTTSNVQNVHAVGRHVLYGVITTKSMSKNSRNYQLQAVWNDIHDLYTCIYGLHEQCRMRNFTFAFTKIDS